MMKETIFRLIDIFERHFNTKKCGHPFPGGHSYNAGSVRISCFVEFEPFKTMREDK
jgi:membrane-associated PAP2 superfamily phosphatase